MLVELKKAINRYIPDATIIESSTVYKVLTEAKGYICSLECFKAYGSVRVMLYDSYGKKIHVEWLPKDKSPLEYVDYMSILLGGASTIRAFTVALEDQRFMLKRANRVLSADVPDTAQAYVYQEAVTLHRGKIKEYENKLSLFNFNNYFISF